MASVFILLILSPFQDGTARRSNGDDSIRVIELLTRGDDAYREKRGFSSFQRSLQYFDSARHIATRSRDPRLMAEVTFARGRVYDAWNKSPQRTISLFRTASSLFLRAGDTLRYFYTKHLVAHAYDKIKDSARTVAVLHELIDELREAQGAREKLSVIPEMALVATEVQAYPLADSILRTLTDRARIVNNTSTYDFRDRYFITRARLDVYWRGLRRSPYLDSLATVCDTVSRPFEQIFYSRVLSALYARAGDYRQAYKYRSLHAKLEHDVNTGSDIAAMQEALVASETESERRKAAYDQKLYHNTLRTVWMLSLLLVIITVLSLYLYRGIKRYRAQSQHLHRLNGELDRRADEVAVLNKEIQHRVKNNLYTVYSLLRMQEKASGNEAVASYLGTARLRVESIATLHDFLLSGSGDVDFDAYIRRLVDQIVASATDREVRVALDAVNVSLLFKTSVAVSLILNEWITNSIKYAQPENEDEALLLTISVSRQEGFLCITYADNGVPPVPAPVRKGLGTDIIRLLSMQIRGRLTTASGHPYHYNLCIPHGDQSHPRPDR